MQRAGRPLQQPAKGFGHLQRADTRNPRDLAEEFVARVGRLQRGCAASKDKLSAKTLRLPGATVYTAKAGCQELCRRTAAKCRRHHRHCCSSRQPPTPPTCRADSVASRPWWTQLAQQSTTCQGWLPRSFATSKCLALQLTCKERAQPAKGFSTTETDRDLFINLLEACPTFKELITFQGGPRGLLLGRGFSLRLPWALRLPRALRVP